MALRWVLIVIADSNAMTDAEEVVRGLGLHAAIAPNLAQAATQARSLRPVLLISDQKPDAASAPPCPVLIVGATIDRVQLKAQILALVPEGSPPPSPAPPPATATPVNAPEPVPTPAAPPPPPPKQWMVITSADPGVAAIVDLALLGLGLDTASAADAGQTAAKASELKPQLILCDLDLPGLEDAAAALANLRRNPGTSAVPLLLIASKDADETLSKAVAGDKTVRFLKKPLDAETLRLELSRLLGGEETPPPAAPEPAEPAPAAPPAAPVSRGAALVLEADPAAGVRDH